MRAAALVVCVSVLTATGLISQQRDFPVLTGPYLGQTPPGSTPEVFAPGIVSRDSDFEHSAAVFSPDGTEVFWCARRNRYSDRGGDDTQQLYHMRLAGGRWTPPEIAPFTRGMAGTAQRPVFGPDGNRLYFDVYDAQDDDVDIYFVERQGDGWSRPAPVSPLINSPAIERLHDIGADGSMYFTRNLMTSREEVLVSRFVSGAFTGPEALGEDFNSDATEYALVLARDESYMLICQSRSTRTPSRIHVSYREPGGTWSERIATDYPCGGFLALSPDGRYLFALDDEIFWVSTSFVDELRPGSRSGEGSRSSSNP